MQHQLCTLNSGENFRTQFQCSICCAQSQIHKEKSLVPEIVVQHQLCTFSNPQGEQFSTPKLQCTSLEFLVQKIYAPEILKKKYSVPFFYCKFVVQLKLLREFQNPELVQLDIKFSSKILVQTFTDDFYASQIFEKISNQNSSSGSLAPEFSKKSNCNLNYTCLAPGPPIHDSELHIYLHCNLQCHNGLQSLSL